MRIIPGLLFGIYMYVDKTLNGNVYEIVAVYHV